MTAPEQHDEADPRYPIGQFTYDGDNSAEARDRHIGDLAALPDRLRDAVRGLGQEQLDTPYRQGGWTVRQLVHHVADSHMHAYLRWKSALAEDSPVVKPYDEGVWARMPDVQRVPIETSLDLLHSVHQRLVSVMHSMSDADFNRGYFHTEHRREFPLHEVLAMYAWHGKHHTAHVTALRGRNGWR